MKIAVLISDPTEEVLEKLNSLLTLIDPSDYNRCECGAIIVQGATECPHCRTERTKEEGNAGPQTP